MKRYKNKMMTPVDVETKGAECLICIQECNVPGVGTWKNGDKIKDSETISKISGSPYFMPITEVE